MANVSNIVNVSVVPQGRSLSRGNMNIVALFTSQLGALSSSNRSKAYTDLSSIADDFGTTSAVYQHASVLFSGTKNPCNSGGYLVVAYWRSTTETVSAKAGYLKGIQLSESVIVNTLQSVSDGSFKVTVDGTEQTVTGLDFRTIDELSDIVDLINDEITGATASINDQRIIITSATTGIASEVSLLTANTTGTFIGVILGLSIGTGAIAFDGLASGTLTAESKIDSVTEALKEEPFKGFTFLDNPTDLESKALAVFAQANDILSYDVFDSASNLEKDITNVVWDIKLSGLENYRMIYRKDGDRKVATAEMTRLHTVNFNNENSAITLNLKELKGIVSEDYSQDEINKAKKVGLDLYTNFGDLPKLLTSGANGWADNVYNIIAIKNYIQTDVFNLLGTTGTKLAQIKRDVNKIVDTIEKTLILFRKANVIGAGTWNSADDFSDPLLFRRSILANGYFIYAQPLSEQVQSDRVARKSPAIQVALKLAGAIHSVDITLSIEE